MKRLVALAFLLVLSALLTTVAGAAPMGTRGGTPAHQEGLKNSKKVAQSKRERDKKFREVKKQAYAKRLQAQNGR